MEYTLYSAKNNGFWSNESGWGNFADAQRYHSNSVPIGVPDGVMMPASPIAVGTVAQLKIFLDNFPDDMPIRGFFESQPNPAWILYVVPGKYVDPNGGWADTDDGGDNKPVVRIDLV